MAEDIYEEVSDALDKIMVKLSYLCGNRPDCNLCKADLALGLMAVLDSDSDSKGIFVSWTKEHYNALNKIADEEAKPRKIIVPQSIQDFLRDVTEGVEQHALCRKVLAYRTVGSSEVVRYDKDADKTAYMVGEHGDVVRADAGRYCYPPERQITHSIDIQYLMSTRYTDDVIVNIIKEEDAPFVAMLKKCANYKTKEKKLPDLFYELKHAVEDTGSPCKFLMVNSSKFSKFVSEISEKHGLGYLRDIFKISLPNKMVAIYDGYLGVFDDDVQIISTSNRSELCNLIAEDEVFAVPPTEYLGGMPVRIKLFAFKDDDSPSWTIYELISQVIIAPDTVFAGKWEA